MISEGIQYFKYFLKDPNKKNYFNIVKELILFGWKKKELPTDYFRRSLYRKEIKNYFDYLTLKETRRFMKSNDIIFPEIKTILDNKLCTHLYLKQYDIPVPELISYNLKNTYFFNNTINILNTKDDLKNFFNNVFKSNSGKSIFLKPFDANGGKGVLLLKKSILFEQIEKNSITLLNESYIHQELVEQHEDVNKIHSKSLNTLRIETYIDDKNNINILSVLMRFGSGNSIADNFSLGGFIVSVNTNTGKLQGKGKQDLLRGGKVFVNHPDTNVLLDGHKLPYFFEACELVKKAAKILPNRITGWDIALTTNGPIIIEGNTNPAFSMSDISYGGYLKNPLMKKLVNKYK